MPAIFEHLFGFNFFLFLQPLNLSTYSGETANMHEIVSKIVTTYVSLTVNKYDAAETNEANCHLNNTLLGQVQDGKYNQANIKYVSKIHKSDSWRKSKILQKLFNDEFESFSLNSHIFWLSSSPSVRIRLKSLWTHNVNYEASSFRAHYYFSLNLLTDNMRKNKKKRQKNKEILIFNFPHTQPADKTAPCRHKSRI